MRSLKNLPHRDWGVIRDLWIDHLPDIDFSLAFPEPALWDLPEVKERLSNPPPNTELPYVDGVRESVFREAVVLTRKFSYCRMVGFDAATRGFPTWSVVAEYDACFYGAKAVCYLLGFASLARDSKLYLDLFVPRRLGKAKQPVYDVLVAYRLDERLTHNILWNLTGRLCRTLSLPVNARPLSDDLHSISFDRMSSFRNNLIYHGGYWLNWDDFLYCDLTRSLSNLDIFRALQEPPDNPRDAERYFMMAARLHNALVYFFSDIAKLAPAIGPEVTALTNWWDQRA